MWACMTYMWLCFFDKVLNICCMTHLYKKIYIYRVMTSDDVYLVVVCVINILCKWCYGFTTANYCINEYSMLKFIGQQCTPNDPQKRIHDLQYTVKTNSECWKENKEKIGIPIKQVYVHALYLQYSKLQWICWWTKHFTVRSSDVINCIVWPTDLKHETLKSKS